MKYDKKLQQKTWRTLVFFMTGGADMYRNVLSAIPFAC